MSLPYLAALAWLAQAGAALAPASGTPVDLVVERRAGAADCPDGPGLAASVAAIVGRAGPATGRALAVDVTFSRDVAAYRAQLQLRGDRGAGRALSDAGTSCAALGRAVAIALALWLDASSDAGRSLPEDAGAASPAPSPASSPARPSTFSAPAPASGFTSGFFALRGGPAWGYVGDAPGARGSWAGALELGLRLGARATVAVDAGQVLTRTTPLAEGDVAVTLRAARLLGCAALNAPPAPLQLAACAVGAAGALRGEGRGFAATNASTVAFWSAGAELRAETLVRGRWLLALAADVEVPLRSYTFSVAEVGRVNGTARWLSQLLLAVGARLW